MRFSLKPLELIEVNIPFNPPKRLEALAKKTKGKGGKRIGSLPVFPPMSIEMILDIFLKEEFKKLNFFDIMKLLNEIEKDTLKDKIQDKVIFVQLLQELFNQSPRYIKNFILKRISSILKSKENHSLKNQLSTYMTSKEFKFVKYCIKSDFEAIKKNYKDKSIKGVLKFFSLKSIFPHICKAYAMYLIEELERKKIMDEQTKIYTHNLLDDEESTQFHEEIGKLISLIERKVHTQFIDKLLIDKLGNIEDENSNWHTKQVPLDLQDSYRRVKGIFEFQRFVTIAEYISPSLIGKNPNIKGTTDDATRLTNRTLFWSNYDEKFASVDMWLSKEDYKELALNRIVSLDNIKVLEDISNEACLLEFKEIALSVLVFFRKTNYRENLRSLIFEDDNVQKVKEMLKHKKFSRDVYQELASFASFQLTEGFIWTAWVDTFLRERKIYPNPSVVNRQEKFKIAPNFLLVYTNQGLVEGRRQALEQGSRYEDVILLLHKE